MATPERARDPRRWLAPDRAGVWEEVVVTRADAGEHATVLGIRFATVPRYLPGQYFLLRLATPGPPGAVEQAYSLSSSPFPGSPLAEMAVRAIETGRVSPALAHEVVPGDLLHVRGPYGFLTWTEEDGGPIALVGAGTGIAPLVSIVRYAAARGCEVPMTVLCSSRDTRLALFKDELAALARRHPWLEVVHTATRETQDVDAAYHRRIDAPMLTEVLHLGRGAAQGARDDQEGRDEQGGREAPRSCYVAGPAGMVTSVRAALGTLGMGGTAVYTEDHA